MSFLAARGRRSVVSLNRVPVAVLVITTLVCARGRLGTGGGCGASGERGFFILLLLWLLLLSLGSVTRLWRRAGRRG